MFLGQYMHSLDTKGRLTVPVRFRAALASGAYIVQGFERNLSVYTTESYSRLSEKASSHSYTNPEVRALLRMVYGRSSEVHLDSTGRILIPSFLREWAVLEDEAAIVGVGDHFEIWNSENWDDFLTSITDPEINAQRFSEFDLSTG
ncbi:MAG: division/cell wall cluster transcriptional repressor MraZ [Anaerolineales bacterium]|nr:division/cell wall cluster transcriptional repressor MraZ [Anaerolineales bacterium]